MTPADPPVEGADGDPELVTAPAPEPDPGSEAPPAEEVQVLEVDAPHTGVSVVDDVLASLDGVEGRPVEERVPAFERTQEGLREALTDPDEAGDPGDPAGA